MLKAIHERKVKDFKAKRPSMTVPNQSMSIDEIVKRFTRGLPVDIVQRQPVYLDQVEYDFEKLSRMDFGDKAAFADEMAAKAKRIQAEHNERVNAWNEEVKRRQEAAQQAAKGPGIVSLDNTMPGDTKVTTK